jgi:hypothetical protein
VTFLLSLVPLTYVGGKIASLTWRGHSARVDRDVRVA